MSRLKHFMKKTIFLITILALTVLHNQAQDKVPDKFQINCTGERIKQLSIVIYSRKSSGKFTFQDNLGNRYKGGAAVLYPDNKLRAGISFESSTQPGSKNSVSFGVLRYDNNGMILYDAENHQGTLRWRLNAPEAKFLNAFDPALDGTESGISNSDSKAKNRYDEFTVTCKAK